MPELQREKAVHFKLNILWSAGVFNCVCWTPHSGWGYAQHKGLCGSTKVHRTRFVQFVTHHGQAWEVRPVKGPRSRAIRFCLHDHTEIKPWFLAELLSNVDPGPTMMVSPNTRPTGCEATVQVSLTGAVTGVCQDDSSELGLQQWWEEVS